MEAMGFDPRYWEVWWQLNTRIALGILTQGKLT